MQRTFFLLILFLSPLFLVAQSPSATDIIKRSDEKLRGKTSYGEMTMTIVRPTWSREVGFKSWSKGSEKALIVITGPKRDKGSVFLKRDKEMWNWRPTIGRTIKMPPSMMMQSWMGSDFTNDDLVKESSAIDDYTHKLLGSEKIQGLDCWKVELTPTRDAAVVWGKVISWVDKKDYMQLQAEFYDEDDYLVNTMIASDITTLGGKTLPATLTMIPADEPGHKTVVNYKKLEFDRPIADNFFSEQNMRRIQ